MKSYAFLFWAYNVVWAGIAAYVLWLFVRMRQVGRRLDALERALDARSSDREPRLPQG